MSYTVHGILQARILQWVAFPFSRGSSQPRDRTQVSCIAGRFCPSWDTKEALLRTDVRVGHKEGWVQRMNIFKLVLEKTLQSPFKSEKIKPVNSKGNQSWIFIGRTDAEAEDAMLWPPDVKNQLIGKDPDTGNDWGLEKRTTEDEMVGWHHQLSGHEFEHTLGVGERQGSLSCHSPWGCKESDVTEQLNNNWVWVGLPSWLSGKECTCQCRRRKRHRFNPWVGMIPWRRKWEPPPVIPWENPMDRGAWWAAVHRVTKSWTWLSN